VHTEISAASGADTPYDRRPWLSQYPPDVAPSLELPSESIWDVLENTVKRFGDRSALVFQNFGMTYRELRDHAARMSSALRAAGVEEGDVVLALLPNLPHFPVTYYGTLRLGAAPHHRLTFVSGTRNRSGDQGLGREPSSSPSISCSKRWRTCLRSVAYARS